MTLVRRVALLATLSALCGILILQSTWAQTSAVSDRAWSLASRVRLGQPTEPVVQQQTLEPTRPLPYRTMLPPTNNPDVRVRVTTNTSQSELSMAVSPLDPKVILGSANASDFPVTVIYGTGAYWSTDAGTTWSGFDQPPSGNGNQGDPASVIDRNGWFYVGSIAPNDGQGTMRSTDGGTTWTYYQISNPNGSLLDKNHMTVDNSPTSPYEGNLYAAWTDFGQPDPNPIEGARSTNGGVTWVNEQNWSGSVMTTSEFGQGVNLATGPNGEVYAVWAINMGSSPYTEQALGFNKSTDGGVTWGAGSRAITNIKGIRTSSLSPFGIRANSFPVMAVSRQTGHIYVVWTNIGVPGVNTGDADVYMIKSTNGGTSWSTPFRVNDDTPGNNAVQFFGWVTVDPQTDQVSIVFYDNRAHIGTSTTDVTVAHSVDGGATFENFFVNDVSFALGPLPGFGGNYAGDYIGIAADGSRAYPFWTAQLPSTNSQGWMSPILYYPPNGGSVKGIVTSGGSPLSGVRVDFTDAFIQVPSTTGPDGSYKSSIQVEPGTTALRTIRAQKFGYITKTETVSVVRSDTVTRNLVMNAAPGGTLRVHAFTTDSSAVVATVQVIFAGQTVITDSTNPVTGLFSTPLPIGSYDVIVDPPSPYGTRTFTGVTITAGNTTPVNAWMRAVIENSPAAMRDTLAIGQTRSKTLVLTNTTTDSVYYRLTDDNALLRAKTGRPKPLSVPVYEGYTLPKDAIDPHPGMAPPEGSGGPDVFGYAWIDSDEPGGPVFSWTDITSVGTLISTWTGTADDGRFITALPFNFPYYGADYNQVKIVTNGWIGFDVASTSNAYSNTALPTAADPNLAIYAFWDDLNVTSGGTVHYYNDVANNRFIVQWTNVPHYGTTTPGLYTFQIILEASGRFTVQYLDMQQTLNSASIGTENATGTDGLQVVFNADYVHNNLAVQFFIPDAPWISESPTSGTIPPGGSQNVSVTFDAAGLTTGQTYNAMLFVDPDHPAVDGTINVPASLTVQLATTAVLVLDRANVTFPATQINTTRRDTLTVKNGGATTLTITSITNTNTDFTVSPSSASLVPGDSIKVPLTYTPTATGADTGRVIFLSNSQGTPRIDVILNGTSIAAPVIVAAPATLRDTLQEGLTAAQAFKIFNTATPPASPLYVTLSEGAAWLSVTPAADTIAAGDSASFSATFDASTQGPGTYNANITLASNDPATPSTNVACTLVEFGGPVIVLSPTALTKVLEPGQSATDTVVIRNTGVSPLNWALSEVPAVRARVLRPVAPAASTENTDLPKDKEHPGSSGPVTEGQGGPDGFGYRWIDSDEPGGPVFNWLDITTLGTSITSWAGSDDDGRYLVALPFPFSWYGVDYDSLKIVTNGWVSFDVANTSTAYSNVAIPAVAVPNDVIYGFWDDLDLDPLLGGTVHYYHDAANNRFIVQWTNVPHFGTTTPGLYTYQIILKATGEVQLQYLDMQQTLNSSTIGWENVGGTDGIQIAYNANYVHNNLAVSISRGLSWLSEDPVSGSIAPNDSVKLAVTYSTTGLPTGVYSGVIQIASNDFTQNPKNLPVQLTVGAGTVSVTMLRGWNLISNPVTTAEDSVRQIYPSASFPYAYAFTPGVGYVQEHRLANGAGYWEKFPAAISHTVDGTPVPVDSIPVVAGWNMIGSVTQPVDSGDVVTIPPGLKASPFFSFDNGYLPAATIIPGHGYWMKAQVPGTVILAAAPIASRPPATTAAPEVQTTGATLILTDADGGSQTLYLAAGPDAEVMASAMELPPAGPEGVFDARFESQRMMEAVSSTSPSSHTITIRSSAYPVTLSWDARGMRLVVRDGVNGSAIPTRRVEGKGSLVIASPGVSRMIIGVEPAGVPEVYSLSQNYPNPFNPSTTIGYGIPEPAQVTVRLFDVLGREVVTLVNGQQDAGLYTSVWDGRNAAGALVSSGLYFARVDATGRSGKSFRSTIKMTLMK